MTPEEAPLDLDGLTELARRASDGPLAHTAFIAAAKPSTVLRLIDLARLGEDSPRRDAYWKSVLRSLGARPVTCSACGGSGTVNSADTEPCETCDGGGSEWVRG